MKKALRYVLFVIAGLLAVVVVAIVLTWAIFALRPSAKTVRSAAIIGVQRPFRFGGDLSSHIPFVNYMLVDRTTLYAANTLQGLVAISDLAGSHLVVKVEGLGAVHGVAVDTIDELESLGHREIEFLRSARRGRADRSC